MNQATPSAVARPVDARAAGEAPPGDAGGNCRRGSATGNRGRLIGLRSSGRPRWQSGRPSLIGLVLGGHAATPLRERRSRPPVGAAQSAACHPRQPTPVPWHGTAQIAHLGDTRSAEWPGTISPLPQMQGRRQLCGETKVLAMPEIAARDFWRTEGRGRHSSQQLYKAAETPHFDDGIIADRGDSGFFSGPCCSSEGIAGGVKATHQRSARWCNVGDGL